MFKKSMAALAVLSLSAGLASASEVTLYGIVDNGLLYKHSKVETNGVSTKTDSFALESGISSPSRFGIKGSEDLGNGMTVSFKLENGFNADDGSFGDDRLFNRESSLTLSGDFGKLSFGRMGAIGSAAGDFDAAFAIGDAFDGGDGDVFGMAASDRYDNMVTYQTPSFSGFQATVQYSLNESSVDNTLRENSSQVDRYLGLALTAELGALQGVLAYETQNYASFGDKAQANTEDGQVVYLGGNYDFEVAKVFVMGQYFKGLAENPFAADAFEGHPVDGEGVKGFGAHVGGRGRRLHGRPLLRRLHGQVRRGRRRRQVLRRRPQVRIPAFQAHLRLWRHGLVQGQGRLLRRRRLQGRGLPGLPRPHALLLMRLMH